MTEAIPDGPALGLLELCSIARGVRTVDAMLKRAPVKLVRAGSVHPGKYLVLVGGGVDEVYEATQAGLAVAAETLVDQLFLPNPHDDLTAVMAESQHLPLAAVGVLEAYAAAATIRGADAALKRAEVRALRIQLADGLGGKGIFVFTGLLHDVEEAMAAGAQAIGSGLLAGREIIANPHPDLVAAL